MNEPKKLSFKRKFSDSLDKSKKCIKTEDGDEFIVDPGNLIRESEYFKALFHYESEGDNVIKGISGNTMQSVLTFIEQKTVSLNTENVVPLLKASDFFMLDELLRQIRLEIPKLICDENCIELYQAALNSDHLDIFNVIHRYMQLSFQPVVRKRNIWALSFKDFEKLLSDNKLNISSEEIVWEAIVKWVESDKEIRCQVVPLLLRCMRLDECDESLLQKMIDHPIVQQNKLCSSLTEQNELGLCKDDSLRMRFTEFVKSLSSESVCLGPRESQQKICSLVFGRYLHGKWDPHRSAKVLLESEDKRMIIFKQTHFIPKFVISYGNKIYAFNANGPSFAFDVIEENCTPIPALPERISFCLVNENVYAFCMRSASTACVLSAFIFDLQTNAWKTRSWCSFTPSKVEISMIEAAALKGSVYVAAAGVVCCESIATFSKVYDTKSNLWSHFDLPNTPDGSVSLSFAMASFKGNLYFTWSINTSVYKLKAGNAWEPFQELPYRFTLPTAVVHDGTLIVLDKMCYHHSVHWNEDQKEWRKYDLSRSGVTCNISDPAILWKYDFKFQDTKEEYDSSEKEDSEKEDSSDREASSDDEDDYEENYGDYDPSDEI